MWAVAFLLQFSHESFPTFPCFDIAHNLLAAVALRNALGNNGESFPRNNLVASWIITMVFFFSGGITANILLGAPVIAPLGNTNKLLVATTMWYLVMYSSCDTVYEVGSSFPIKVIGGVMDEIYRTIKIVSGIAQASQIYPNSWAIMIAIGTIRANGSGLTKLVIGLIRKTQTPNDAGLMALPFSTKISMLAAFFLILEKKTGFFGSFEVLHLGITVVFIYTKLCSLYGIPLEKKFSMENWFILRILKRIEINKNVLPDSSQEKQYLKDTQKED